MSALADVISVILVAIAALHGAWALRIWWPLGDEADLARAPVGTRDITKMPSPAACWAVVLVLLAGALWLQLPRDAGGLRGAVVLAGLGVMTLAFLARGVAAYVPALRRFGPEEPFATLDRRYYAPLCLALAAGTAAVLLSGAP